MKKPIIFHDEADYLAWVNRQEQRFGGAFIFHPENSDKKLIVPNSIVMEGENSFLKMLCQGDNTIVAAGANFFMGLCGLNFGDQTSTLLTLAGEPTVTNGYARQAVSRDATGWPPANLVQVNNLWKIATKVVNFTAAGGDFSTTIQRAFMCSVGAGTAGKLFAVGGALANATLIQNGTSFPAQYELYMK